MAVKPIPDGYHTITPYLIVNDVSAELRFIEEALGGKTIFKMDGPGGSISHAEARIGDSMVMMGEPMGDQKTTQVMLYLYVEDTDALYAQAVRAGATSVRQPTNEFYGDRSATVQDPAGNHWTISTHVEDVSMEELQRRLEAMFA